MYIASNYVHSVILYIMYTTVLCWNAHVRIRFEAAIFHRMDDVYIADGLRRTIIIHDSNNITLNKEIGNRSSMILLCFRFRRRRSRRFSQMFSQVHFVVVSSKLCRARTISSKTSGNNTIPTSYSFTSYIIIFSNSVSRF